MSNNINLRIDVSKLDKARLTKNSYTKRDGTAVNEVNANLVLIEKKEPRVRKAGEWTVTETHFIAEKRSKDEEKNYVGIGEVWSKNAVESNFDEIKAIREQHNSHVNYDDTIDVDQIPF